jgi:hypothetical protein
MKINRVSISIHEVVLASIATDKKKSDFSALTVEQQLSEVQKSGPRKISTLFKSLKSTNPVILKAMLKKHPKLIEQIKKPSVDHVLQVLDTHPHALNKLPANKRTEEMVIKAIRPERKILNGPRDIRAGYTVKNVSALHPNTVFTPRVYHEIVKLMHGAHVKTIKKLVATLDKQRKALPKELEKMLGRIQGKKTLASDELNVLLKHKARKDGPCDLDDYDEEFSSGAKPPSIVRATYKPYTITVAYPDSPGFRYEYYIGNESEYFAMLKLQYNAGLFAKRAKEKKYDVKKVKVEL